MNSIKKKLIVYLGAMITCVCLGLGGAALYGSVAALKSNLGTTMPEIAKQTSNYVYGQILGHFEALDGIASRPDISDPSIPMESKIEMLSKEMERTGSYVYGIADAEGNYITTYGETGTGKNDDEYKQALAGGKTISSPEVLKEKDESYITCYVPILHEGEIVGVLYEVIDGNFLAEMTDNVKFGQTGKAFIIDEKGVTIAHVNKDLIKNKDSIIEHAKSDPTYKEVAEFNKRMLNEESGIDEYSFNGKKYLAGFSRIGESPWSLAVQIETKEIMDETNLLTISILLGSLVFICIAIAGVYIIASKITKRIARASDYMAVLAQGDLSYDMPESYLKQKDEIGVMANATKTMQDSIKQMISKIKESATNVNIQSENLSSISEEIASSSQNVTESISNVASGTSTQSDNLNDIVAALDEFGHMLEGMVQNVQAVDSNSKEIGKKAENSNKEMNELNTSMNNISGSFKEFYNKITNFGRDVNKIDEITTLINDISEQTNLLALNAAIEAARAGEAGKGFAVVADEIRVLAEQSKNSAESISQLISSISKNTDSIVMDSIDIDNELSSQVKTINSSIKAFKEIVDGVDNMIPKIETLKSSAEEIEDNKNGIFTKLDELSSISVEVSASAEEISASSEEMNAATEEVASSAQVLSNMTSEMMEEVNKFKL